MLSQGLKLIVLFGLLSAICNGLYGHFYEPLTRKEANQSGSRAFIAPFLLYFLAGSGITLWGVMGLSFALEGMEWKSMRGIQHFWFWLMVAGYATHIVTEAFGRQKLNQTVYNVLFQSQTIFLLLINMMMGRAVTTVITWIFVILLVLAGVIIKSEEGDGSAKFVVSGSMILAIASALTRAVAFTIDGFLATEVLNWYIYEGFTFLIPSIVVLCVATAIGRKEGGTNFLCNAIVELKQNRRLYLLASFFSAFEFLFGVHSMNIAGSNTTLPSALQGSVPLTSLSIESIFHPHRITKMIALGAGLATLALVGIALTT